MAEVKITKEKKAEYLQKIKNRICLKCGAKHTKKYCNALCPVCYKLFRKV